ncbi:uncharacterized protein [Temnothorax longispinosus]|uniref:uncharacterized protein n=1 Tax=Temnothorax longispinosus TaxID=300112 RepID=UPI003A9958F8
MENRELDLLEQSALLNSKEEFCVWEQRCNEYLESLKEEHNQAKEPQLSFGIKLSLITRIARLEDLIDSIRKRFEHAGARKDDDDNAVLRWHEIDTAFGSCILTGAVVNSKHIEPRKFLEDAKDIVIDSVRNVMQTHANIKINTVFNGEFVTSDKRAKKSVDTKNCELLRLSDLREWYELHVAEPILASLEEFQERDSGWTLSRIINLIVNVNKYQPMHAGCWIELPQEVKLKKAVINVHSQDNACFAWSVVAALHPSEKRSQRESSYPHYSSVLNLQEIEFPMTLSQIKTFEHFNNVSINVYCVEKKEELVILPIRLADEKKDKHVNLLYLQDTRNNNMGHFAWIKNLSRLISAQVSKEKKKKFFCDRCLHYFSSNAKLAAHPTNCREMNGQVAIKLPHKSFRWLGFSNDNREDRVPFVVYADLKFTLKKTDDDAQTSTYQHHQIFSIGYYVHCAYDDSLSVYRFRRDKDCLPWFAEELRRIARNVKSILSGNVHDRFPATDFTHKDLQCIPIVFHDLSGYDAHFIINEITTAYEGGVEVLPITKEKYISFTKNFHIKSTVDNEKTFMKLRFIDSYKFFKTSLDKSVSFLNKDKLRILQKEFCKLPREHFDLLMRKNVFPYEYTDCVEKLDDLCLPPRESFYSSSTDDTVSESDYAHAVNVWQRFSIQTLGQYSDLYLKTDVLLLADMFENFRDSCISSYKLDPAYYCTLSDFTWDAMLKHTCVNFALLTDIDIVMFIERGTRGGLNQCSNRYARANNKYMQSYDTSKPSSYLMYFDINNLYGWAMCQPLPYADFRWVKNISDFDVTTVALDSPTGYILEVDLEYPQYLHDAHSDLPFCPTRDKPPGKRQDKLLATLYDKKHYIIHYHNLQQCIRHGLRVTKIHRVLQFAQSPWLRDYIELNTKFGKLAKNDFEKNLYEWMNIALFSKFTENVRNHVDVRLVTKWNGRYGAEAMIAKPNFRSRSVFSENAVAIKMQKLEVKFNKPIYVGMCILDIAKTCLYEFHYKYMLPLYREKCKVMYTDTDSLIYHIECDDVYDTMKRDIDKYDTSDYAVDNAYGIPLANEKVPGLMKDKNHGAIMTEFVGIRAKMYALRVDGKKDTNEIKSEIKSNVVAKEITFDDYTLCLRDEIEMTRQQSSVKSELDEVHYTITNTKIALNPYDDKRYIVPNSTETLPWGHYEIPL